MTQTNHHPRTTVLWLTLLGFLSITMLTIVESSPESESLSISKRSSFSAEKSLSKEGPLLTFLLRPVNSSTALVQSNPDNNVDAATAPAAAIHRKDAEHYILKQNKDNESDNNDSNVSSESDRGEGLRFRREQVKIPSAGGGEVIATNWGTYEEQLPVVVVNSESHTNDRIAVADDDESSSFSDEFQSRERDDSSEYAGSAGQSSISYEDYEAGRFEGRQFYPSRSGGGGGGAYDSGEQEEQPDGYYRQKYYATTMKPLNQQQQLLRGEQSYHEEPGKRPFIRHPNRGGPQRKEDQEEDAGGILGIVQKAKTFYDIFRAMNTAWKTVEDHYRRTGEGIFPEDLNKMNESTRMALLQPQLYQQLTNNNNNKQTNTKRLKTTTTAAAITSATEEKQQQETTQESDESRLRRSSSLDGLAIGDEEIASRLTTLPPVETVESLTSTEDSESHLESDSETDSSSSTDVAVAEGRYIKGDPLKGYYDFVITEGSYKFWAVFQVFTAVLIIYSTFAAIYYSKVNPLVSDYDYIDYLGGGRSLSDDSDFVDTDAPAGDASAADGSKVAAIRGGGSASSRKQQQSSAGWFGWLPHAGHTLRFILESIDKEYNEETK